MIPQPHFKTEEKLQLRRDRGTSSFSPCSSPPYLLDLSTPKSSGTVKCPVNHRGEWLWCQHNPELSAPAWCTGGVPQPEESQGSRETRQEPAAPTTATEETQMGPGAMSRKTPPLPSRSPWGALATRVAKQGTGRQLAQEGRCSSASSTRELCYLPCRKPWSL